MADEQPLIVFGPEPEGRAAPEQQATIKNTWQTGDQFAASDENAHATQTNQNTTDIAPWKAEVAPVGAVVGTTDVQTITNKTYSGGQIVGGQVNNCIIQGYTEGYAGQYTVTTARTIDISADTIIFLLLTANTLCNVTMPPGAVGNSFIVVVNQAASTGNGTINFGSSVYWPGGKAPVMTPTAGAIDVFTFVKTGWPNCWLGTYAQFFKPAGT